MVFVTEDERKRYIENTAHEFTMSLEQQEEWNEISEEKVIKILKLWIKMNNFSSDLSIWVDPLSEYRYRLVPVWRLSVWERDNHNIYNYPLSEK